jgi:hypothetical protein
LVLLFREKQLETAQKERESIENGDDYARVDHIFIDIEVKVLRVCSKGDAEKDLYWVVVTKKMMA